MKRFKSILLLLILTTTTQVFAQSEPPSELAVGSVNEETRVPNKKRIRRHLELLVGVDHDEEFLIPEKELTIGGRTEFFDISRIKGTDYFRITPKKSGNGVTTLKDKKTGQILVEIRFTIRDDTKEKTLREVQSLLGDVEGLEFKIINESIFIDGYVLIPKDIIRINQVVAMYPDGAVRSMVQLSPLSWKKIADFISTEINNPEIKVTPVGGLLKLEGQVNNKEEKARILQIVSLYIPDLVVENIPNTNTNSIIVPKVSPQSKGVESLIIDLITLKATEEKVEPPPKMIQVVAHFVKFADNYAKNFTFKFSPAFSAQSSNGQPSNSTIDSTINLVSNLLPKLNWLKRHGYAKVLDSASVLIQNGETGSISRTIKIEGSPLPPAQAGGLPTPTFIEARVSLSTTPTIKSERSGLVELKKLIANVSAPGSEVEKQSEAKIETTITVRDRQSAAFGGVIKKSTETNYGSPIDSQKDVIITLNSSKSYGRSDSQFVVFVTPIIKASASAGVEQVKKKFRLKD